MNMGAKLNKVLFLLVTICVAMSIVACNRSGSENPLAAGPTESLRLSTGDRIIGVGDGSTDVTFGHSIDDLNTINLQVRVTGVPVDTDLEVAIPVASGGPLWFKKTALPGDGLVLACPDPELALVPPFPALSFSHVIPPGAEVEIVNLDLAARLATQTFNRASILRTPYITHKRCDYDGDGLVTSHDIALFIAWIHIKRNDVAKVTELAKRILPSVTRPIASFPDPLIDNLDGDSEGLINNEDIVFLIAAYQANSMDREVVYGRARELLSTIDHRPVFLPSELLPEIVLKSKISGFNSQNLQIHLRNFAGVGAFPANVPLTILKGRNSSGMTKDLRLEFSEPINEAFSSMDRTVFVYRGQDVWDIDPFDRLFFLLPIPDGVVVEVFNNDTKEVAGGEIGPAKPSMVYPANDEENIPLNPVLKCTSFSGNKSSDVHTVSDWEIYRDDPYWPKQLFWAKYGEQVSLASISVTSLTGKFSDSWSSLTALWSEEFYYARVRHYDQNGAASPWSDFVKFKTWVTPYQRSVSSPHEWGKFSVNPVLEAESFYDQKGLSHKMTDWEIYTQSVKTENLVWSKYADSANKSQILVNSANGTFSGLREGQTSLDYNSEYYVRFRFYNTAGVPSPWSAARKFTTWGFVAKPNIILPVAGSQHVAPNPVLKSSAFNQVNSGSTHSSSNWEIYDKDVVAPENRVWFRNETWYEEVLEIEVRADWYSRFENALQDQSSLATCTDYYARIRHQDSTGLWSEWSDLTPFRTWNPPARPVIEFPADGAVNISCNPEIRASAFSGGDVGDTFKRAEWEIYSEINPWLSRTWHGENTATSITVTKSATMVFDDDSSWTSLRRQRQYWVRVRYVDNHDVTSEWSEYVSFATCSPPDKTSVAVEHTWTDGSIPKGAPMNPKLSGGYFNDPNPADLHRYTDWEVWTSTNTAVNTNRVWFKMKDSFHLKETRVDAEHGAFENALSGKTALTPSNVYYCRVRYYDQQDNVAEWSDLQLFHVQNRPVTPTLSVPADGATYCGIYEPMLTSSAFSGGDSGDRHTKTDWEVYESKPFNYSARVWSKYDAAYVDYYNDFRTTIHVTAEKGNFENSLRGKTRLVVGKDYWVRVRHYDQSDLASEWSEAVKFSTRPKAVQVACGTEFTLILLADDSVWATGRNNEGQLGIGNTINKNIPTRVQNLNAVSIAVIAAGDEFAVALATNGSVYSWGKNTAGQLGDGSFDTRTSPAQVPGLKSVSRIAVGADFVLALDASGRIYAWGRNDSGQLGTGDTNVRESPTLINSGGVTFTDVACGYDHSLAISTDGKVYAWGENGNGQLGINSQVDAYVPTIVDSLANVTLVAAGKAASFAVRENGDCYGWGSNDYYRLGFSQTGDHLLPVKNLTLSSGSNPVIALALDRKGNTDWNHRGGIAVRSDFSVWEWSRNAPGGTPFQVYSGANAVSADIGGGKRVLTVDGEGMIGGWGKQNYGEFGNNTDSGDYSSRIETQW